MRRAGSNQFKRRYHILGMEYADFDLIRYVAFVCGVFIVFGLPNAVYQHRAALDKMMLVTQAHASTYKSIPNFKDARTKQVYTLLSRNRSPLTDYAPYIVAMADKYAIDYTIVTAIAGKESSFGKAIEPGSYNAWGYMAWTNGNRHIRHFASWEEGIEMESKLISDGYRLNANQAIGAKYCPVEECSSTWADDVTTFSEQIRGGGDN